MEQAITEKNYPIQGKWVLKSVVGATTAFTISIILLLFGLYNLYLVLFVLISPFYVVGTFLRRSNFHFILEDKYLTVHQGVISKREYHTPYGVIQNVIVKQDLFDKMFNLSSLVIENATQVGAKKSPAKSFWTLGGGGLLSSRAVLKADQIGTSGTGVSIPGLLSRDAESLKALILQKMKENPIENTQSGL